MRTAVVALLVGTITLQSVNLGASRELSQPNFRSQTALVEVSAVVMHDDRPVVDLRAHEVTVFDNGVKQPLVAFEYVDLSRVSGPSQRRDFVVVIDNLHIDPTRTSPTISTALAFIDRLGMYDRLAVVTTAPPSEALDFTTDREIAREFVRRTRGQQQTQSAPGELELRARLAMKRLAMVAASLRSDAERRSVLLISEGHRTLGQSSNFKRDPESGVVEYLDVIRQAALANVSIYTVDPRGLRAPGSASIPSRDSSSPVGDATPTLVGELAGSLAMLALNTGGIQTRWTNDLTAGLSRMIQDSRQYYRLAYVQPDPSPGKSQPLTRTIKVKVSRPGSNVRARQRYAPLSSMF